MANPDGVSDDLSYDFDSRSNPYYQNQAWSMTVEQMESIEAQSHPRRNITPIQTSGTGFRQLGMTGNMMVDNWRYQQMQHQHQHQQQQQQQKHHHHQQVQQTQQPQQQSQPQAAPSAPSQSPQYQNPAQIHDALEYNAAQHALNMSSYESYHNMSIPAQISIVPSTQSTLTATLPIDHAYIQMPAGIDGMPQSWADLQTELLSYQTVEVGVPALSPYQQHTSSPTGSHIEVLSRSSSSDDATWTFVDSHQSYEQGEGQFFVDPIHTLHDRSRSESSYSEVDPPSHQAFMPNLEMGTGQAVYSPTTLSDSDHEYNSSYHANGNSNEGYGGVPAASISTALVRPIAIPLSSKGSSPARSPTSAGSAGSPGRKPSKKSPTAPKGTDRVTKKTLQGGKDGEKKIGRRKGPLKPEQRKQAGEIRKLRACLRCKFLKKTCDKGEPCAGCQPSHARLWQVPCTRIDIKEIGYFLKDKRFDYERHVTLGFSVGNIKGFSDVEEMLYITHGYGLMLPIRAREVYVRDEQCLKMDWVEEANRDLNAYEIATAKLSAGTEGISTTVLSDYLDRHIDGNGTFEKFVDDYFDGTPFLSQMLKVAYKFYYRTKSRVIKKALKLMLAYCLTVHITMVEGIPPEQGFIGKIEDESSRFFGKTIAPVMINFQVKCAMADMWRELHKDVLEELSALYSSVYSGDKLKNWPTIFILASVLLAVWECMQFDCHYRVPDESAVDKFCADMETTPVGVIVGLFSAISQKLPSILDWDTSKHHALLASNPDVCDTMTEVREHVVHYENYLRDRPSAKFDDKNFDSLSNKFLSRLVLRDIRAN